MSRPVFLLPDKAPDVGSVRGDFFCYHDERSKPMKQKVNILWCNRHLFSGYMLALILKWHVLFQNKNFRPELIGHNSVLFINRALDRFGLR
jgi:hypothetical protein